MAEFDITISCDDSGALKEFFDTAVAQNINAFNEFMDGNAINATDEDKRAFVESNYAKSIAQTYSNLKFEQAAQILRLQIPPAGNKDRKPKK